MSLVECAEDPVLETRHDAEMDGKLTSFAAGSPIQKNEGLYSHFRLLSHILRSQLELMRAILSLCNIHGIFGYRSSEEFSLVSTSSNAEHLR